MSNEHDQPTHSVSEKERPQAFFFFVAQRIELSKEVATGLEIKAMIKAEVPSFDPSHILVLEGHGPHGDEVVKDDQRISLEVGPHEAPKHFYSKPPTNNHAHAVGKKQGSAPRRTAMIRRCETLQTGSRTMKSFTLIRTFCLLIAALAETSAWSQVSVVAQHNDISRSGANLQEKKLTVASVKQKFGKLWTLFADGQIVAQPLYVSGLTVAGKGTFNALIVSTMHNTIYVYDADKQPAQPQP